MGTAIRVALVEDDPDTRLLVRFAADLDPRFELVAEYESLHEAVPGLLHQHVDVVLVDQLRTGNRTLELLAQLRATAGRARIVVVAHEQDPVPTNLAVAAGADAFLDHRAFTRVSNALQLAAGGLSAAA